jgi:hypothetical protein
LSTDQISARIQAFARELGELVQSEALEAVRRALSGKPAGAKPAQASAPRAPAKASPRRKRGRAKSASPGPKAAVKASGSTPETEKLIGFIKTHPGLRLEAIAKGIGAPSEKLKSAVSDLVASKKLRKEGKTRGTTYFVS